MICKQTARTYCRGDITLIKNYEEAILDLTQTWECHHVNEQWWTVDELKFVNRYYNVPPDELVFLTKAEHCKFHRKYGPSSKSIIDSQNGFSSRCELAKKQKLYHDKLVEGCKKRSSNPEYCENLAKSMEKCRDYRVQKLREAFKNKTYTEEERLRRSEARKLVWKRKKIERLNNSKNGKPL